jgi:tetratricopeptide (TPR) repeat protein
MANVGRNDPCACGSGKKYKRCCLSKDEAAAAAQRPLPEPKKAQSRSLRAFFNDFDDDTFTAESNAVVGLIRAGDLDGAEAAARKLLVDYPDVIDGHDRLGMVYEAREDYAAAVANYRQVLQQMEADVEAYDDEGREAVRQRIERLEAKIPS